MEPGDDNDSATATDGGGGVVRGDVSADAGSGWRCDVCTQLLQVMLQLPCGHRYCERCLRVWVGVYVDSYRSGRQEFPCRICWHYFHIPSPDAGGLDAFKRCYVVDSLGADLMTQLRMMDTSSSTLVDASDVRRTDYGDVQCYTTQEKRAFAQSDVDNCNAVMTSTPGVFDTRLPQTGDAQHHRTATQHAENNRQGISNVAPDAMTSSDRLQTPVVAVNVPQTNHYGPTDNADDNDVMMDDTSADDSVTSPLTTSTADNQQQQQQSCTRTAASDMSLPLSDHDVMCRRRLCFPSCHTYMYHLA